MFCLKAKVAVVFAAWGEIAGTDLVQIKGIFTQKAPTFVEAFRDPAGIRTQDHYIKSVMLYQLSYGIIPP
jgi:hypothetical protein